MKSRTPKFILISLLSLTLLVTLACQLLALPSLQSNSLSITDTPEQAVSSNLLLTPADTSPAVTATQEAVYLPNPTDLPTLIPTDTQIPTMTDTLAPTATSTPPILLCLAVAA